MTPDSTMSFLDEFLTTACSCAAGNFSSRFERTQHAQCSCAAGNFSSRFEHRVLLRSTQHAQAAACSIAINYPTQPKQPNPSHDAEFLRITYQTRNANSRQYHFEEDFNFSISACLSIKKKVFLWQNFVVAHGTSARTFFLIGVVREGEQQPASTRGNSRRRWTDQQPRSQANGGGARGEIPPAGRGAQELAEVESEVESGLFWCSWPWLVPAPDIVDGVAFNWDSRHTFFCSSRPERGTQHAQAAYSNQSDATQTSKSIT